MELTIFGRFHVKTGCEDDMLAALADVAGPTRAETGCLFFQSYRSIRDPGLFHINSRWTDEEAFDLHARLEHTVGFLTRVQDLTDQPPEVTRARPVSGA